MVSTHIYVRASKPVRAKAKDCGCKPKTRDAFEESKHPREGGKFSSVQHSKASAAHGARAAQHARQSQEHKEGSPASMSHVSAHLAHTEAKNHHSAAAYHVGAGTEHAGRAAEMAHQSSAKANEATRHANEASGGRHGYSASGVQAAINSSRKPIGGKEGKAIHALLKGRS